MRGAQGDRPELPPLLGKSPGCGRRDRRAGGRRSPCCWLSFVHAGPAPAAAWPRLATTRWIPDLPHCLLLCPIVIKQVSGPGHLSWMVPVSVGHVCRQHCPTGPDSARARSGSSSCMARALNCFLPSWVPARRDPA